MDILKAISITVLFVGSSGNDPLWIQRRILKRAAWIERLKLNGLSEDAPTVHGKAQRMKFYRQLDNKLRTSNRTRAAAPICEVTRPIGD